MDLSQPWTKFKHLSTTRGDALLKADLVKIDSHVRTIMARCAKVGQDYAAARESKGTPSSKMQRLVINGAERAILNYPGEMDKLRRDMLEGCTVDDMQSMYFAYQLNGPLHLRRLKARLFASLRALTHFASGCMRLLRNE
jgi:hypothetical protein